MKFCCGHYYNIICIKNNIIFYLFYLFFIVPLTQKLNFIFILYNSQYNILYYIICTITIMILLLVVERSCLSKLISTLKIDYINEKVGS